MSSTQHLHLLNQLAEMPVFLEKAFAGMSRELLVRMAADDNSPLIEHLWHLEDCESDLYRPRIERVLNEDRTSLLPMDVETWAFPNRNTCVTISDMSLRNVPFRSYHHHGSSPLRRGSLCLIAAKPGTH